MRTLYFDCFAGASGNMILGALLDLGVDRKAFKHEIEKLRLEGVSVEVTKVDRSGIEACHVVVHFPVQKRHRHLSDIERIIDDSEISISVKECSKGIFRKLAEAEATVHGTSVQKVHFHEIGAVDAIVDIVGACICFGLLGIERFASSALNTGSGFVEMDHGKYPVPPPAVAELVSGLGVYSNEIEGELLTPTGAAIISTLCSRSEPLPAMTVDSTGYGAGTREYEKFPNVIRLIAGDVAAKITGATIEELRLIETNIDDSTPQVLGFVMDRAFELGALDCWFTPVHMKKNRPAVMLSMLSNAQAESELKRLLFTETSTIGVRVRTVTRECLERTFETVETEFGPVEVKISTFEGRVVNMKPEFDQMRELAEKEGVLLREVEKAVADALENEKSFEAKG